MMTIMFLFFLFALGALSTCRNIACGAQNNPGEEVRNCQK